MANTLIDRFEGQNQDQDSATPQNIDSQSKNRLDALRLLMKEHKCDAYLISDSDAHYTFYSLSHEDRRINWITQCQAQCGLVLVTLNNNNNLFQVPSNYRLLAKAETNENIWSIVDDIVEWINQHGSEITTIGYDPRFTPLFVTRMFEKLTSNQCHLHPILSSINLIDAISNNETTSKRHTLSPIWSLDELRFAGQTSEDKIRKLRENYLIDGDKNYTLITTAMDEIAWLLNLRGNDMECNPLFYSFMIISKNELIIFTDNPHELIHYDIRPYNDFFTFLSTLESNDIWVDERTSMAVINALRSVPTRISRSPIQQMKEIKNSVELNGFRECHYRDCAAVCHTFAWLEQSIDNNLTVSERDVVKYLEDRQREKDHFISIAFDTISAVRTNTALIEYGPSMDDGGKIIGHDLYYLDGGAHYYDGTTDMTRTLHFGKPTEKQIECYTLLLRGILSVEMTSFKSDDFITGYRIDALLQQYFNAHHYSSKHISFGHGVSHGQGVIEGGINISDVFSLANRVPIRPGMVLTLEPGLYFEGEWGIRIENVYAIEEYQTGWMHFNPLTLIPYSRKMINFNLLNKQELIWINTYHQRCLDKVNGGQWMINEINRF